MKLLNLVFLFFLLFTISVQSQINDKQHKSEWIDLFNHKDLNEWKICSNTNDNKFPNQDLSDLFKVEDSVIKVYPNAVNGSKQPKANMYYKQKWNRFHLVVEYRWLKNKFEPRTEVARDAGILFHIHDNPKRVWPSSIEMQLGDGKPEKNAYVTGDLFVIGKSRAQSPSQGIKYDPNGELTDRGHNIPSTVPNRKRMIKTACTVYVEKPIYEWNTAEVIVDGSKKASFYLNGILLNEVYNMTCFDKDKEAWVPLEEGFISLQAEWAELEYRTVKLKVLD